MHARLLETLKRSGKLSADEATVPVLDLGRGRTKTGQLWAYARDDRPWGGTNAPGVAYLYAIDSNTVERAIQPLALNRKSALFAGSDNGGERWAVIASLVQTCTLVGVEPQAYLADVITRIVDRHPKRHLYNSAAMGLPANVIP